MGKVIRILSLTSSNLKNLIPVWVDHDDKFFSVPGYYIDKDEGTVYSFKFEKIKKIKFRSTKKKPYPFFTISDPVLFDTSQSCKTNNVHRILMLSNIFYFNLLDEYLHKAFPNIPLKQIKKTPIEFKIILLRLLDVHHKDHNKKNYHISNLQLVSKQENSREYEKYRKKAVSRK